MSNKQQPYDDARLARLIEACLDGDATTAEQAELQEWICRDPEAGRQYIRSIHDAIHLQQWASAESEAQFGEPSGDMTELPTAASQRDQRFAYRSMVKLFTHPTPLSMTIAALVIGLLITAMAFMVPPFYRSWANRGQPNNGPSYEFVAEVTATHDAVWDQGELAAYQGAHLVSGRRLMLDSGLVEITFEQGAVILLEGPAVLDVMSDSEARLLSGSLAALVSQPAHGFTVQTAQASIVDLGTEFGVRVQGSKSTNVRVFDGVVDVALHESDDKQKLVAGEELTIASSGDTSRSLATDKNRFVRRIPQSPYRSAVAASRPIAWWSLDDVGGETARDLSGKGRHGLYMGDVVGADETLPNLGRAAQFSGAGYVEVPTFPDLSASQALSAEAWIRYPANIPANWERIVETNYASGFVMTANPATAAQFDLTPGHAMFGINGVFAETPTQITDDRWHHVVGVWDGEWLIVYVDGQPGKPVAFAGGIGNSTQSLRIGANSVNSNQERFQGALDELAIYDRALSAREVTLHFQSAKSADEFLSTIAPDE